TQRRNVLVETSTSNEEEPTNYALMVFTSSSSSSSDNEKNQPTMPSWHSPPQVLPVLIMRKSQFDVLSYKTSVESVEAIFEEDIKLLKLDVMLRDNALVDIRKKFEKAKQERDKLKLKLDKFQISSKNLSQLLASQSSYKTGLGYDNQVFNSTVFDYDEMFSSESNVSMLTSLVHDRYQSGEGYHAVPPPYTGTFMRPNLIWSSIKLVEHPIQAKNLRKDILTYKGHRHSWNRKTCLVCKSLTYLIKDRNYYEKKMVQKLGRNHSVRRNHQLYARMTHPNPHMHVVPIAVLTRSSLVLLNAARLASTQHFHRSRSKHENKVRSAGLPGSSLSLLVLEPLQYA
nr:hypothetical protein [Tanacetum cinerariifolium]